MQPHKTSARLAPLLVLAAVCCALMGCASGQDNNNTRTPLNASMPGMPVALNASYANNTEQSSVVLPPEPPLVPALADVQKTGGPLYKVYTDTGAANSTSVAILWVLPPKFNLAQEKAFPPLTVKQGSLIELAWAGDVHNAYWLSSSACPRGNAEPGRESVIRNLIPSKPAAKLSDYPNAQKAVTASKGTFYLVCTVDAHCQRGMKLQINVV